MLQSYPRKEGNQIFHKRWEVDTETAARVGPFDRAGAPRLQREVEEMGQHFPRWLLTVATPEGAATCKCGGMLVFDRGVRCVQCDKETLLRKLPEGVRAAWFGLMPPMGIDGLTRLKPALLQGAPPQHLVGHKDGMGHYLLVPLLATYPAGFPGAPVQVAYLPGFFRIPGMPPPVVAHAYHLLGNHVMCLFAAGEWRPEMSCREVLQQRAYAHVIKLLNYGNGKKDAFAIVS